MIKCNPGNLYAHHWKLEDKERPTDIYVWGVCSLCEKKRLFRHSHPRGMIDWGRETLNRVGAEKVYARRK